jgi:hypothetical protein
VILIVLFPFDATAAEATVLSSAEKAKSILYSSRFCQVSTFRTLPDDVSDKSSVQGTVEKYVVTSGVDISVRLKRTSPHFNVLPLSCKLTRENLQAVSMASVTIGHLDLPKLLNSMKRFQLYPIRVHFLGDLTLSLDQSNVISLS